MLLAIDSDPANILPGALSINSHFDPIQASLARNPLEEDDGDGAQVALAAICLGTTPYRVNRKQGISGA